jgi:hypothetical protein
MPGNLSELALQELLLRSSYDGRALGHFRSPIQWYRPSVPAGLGHSLHLLSDAICSMPIRAMRTCRININAQSCLTTHWQPSTFLADHSYRAIGSFQSAQSSVILRRFLARTSDHFPSRSRPNRATIAHVPPSPVLANRSVAVPSGVSHPSLSWMSKETLFIFALTATYDAM